MRVAMDIPFVLPGTTEPAITVRRSMFGNIGVLVNGVPLKRRGPGLTYDIPLPDGTSTELRLTGQWTGLRAAVNGVETALEPPVSRFVVALVFLPLFLAVIGGAIGAVVGFVTAGVNLTLSRRAISLPLKLAAMLGMTALGAAVAIGIVFAITPIPTLAAGSCLSGVHQGAAITAGSTKPIDCSVVHENEVVGAFEYAGGGGYPGQSVLLAYAQAPCLQAFADYVGIDFQASSLDMIAVTPSDLSWIKGDRTISCVAVDPKGGTLTGSIRDSGR